MSNDNPNAIAVRERAIERYEPSGYSELLDRAKLFAAALGLRPEQAAVKALYGATLGIPITQAMTGVHLIPSSGGPKVVIDASVLRAVVLRHMPGLVEQFGAVETTVERCVWRAQRAGSDAVDVTWTIDDARAAGVFGKDNWKKFPRQMLAARASAEAARLVFPDLIAGFYSTDEIDPHEHRQAPQRRQAVAPPVPVVSSHAAVLAAASAPVEPEQVVESEPEPEPPHDPETGEVHDPGPDPAQVEAVFTRIAATEPAPPRPADHLQAAKDRMLRAVAEAGADLGPDEAKRIALKWLEGPRRLMRKDSEATAGEKVRELCDALMAAVDAQVAR